MSLTIAAIIAIFVIPALIFVFTDASRRTRGIDAGKINQGRKKKRDHTKRISSGLADAKLAQGSSPSNPRSFQTKDDKRNVIWDRRYLETKFEAGEYGIYHKADSIPDSAWQDLNQVLGALTCLPVEVDELLAVLNSSESSANQVARICEKSVSLTAMVLKLVNSPFYGIGREVDNITEAVALLGFNEIRITILTMSLFKKVTCINPLFDIKDLFKQSVAAANITKWLSKRVKPDIKPGLLGTGAMLSGIGKILLVRWRHDRFIDAIGYSIENQVPLIEAELEVLGVSHALAGFLLLERWQMPDHLSKMVRGSNLPELDPEMPEMAVAFLAAQIARQHLKRRDGELQEDTIQDDLREFLGIEAGTITELMSDGFDEFAEEFLKEEEAVAVK